LPFGFVWSTILLEFFVFLEINNLFLFGSLAICSALQWLVYFRTITSEIMYTTCGP